MSEGKKTIDSLNLEKVSAILLDVAGTTTAINFVKETLLPYVTKNAEEFLKNSWEDEEVKKALSQFEEKDLDVTKATEVIKTLTDKDDSNIGLKAIQGLLYKKGYENGDLKAHIFSDVPKCLESWSKSNKLAVFSTASVDAQELLFKNTIEGDLHSHISKFFDQDVGLKTEADSYTKIAKEMSVTPENVLFLTDDVKEAEAAKSANFIVVLVEREGNAAIPEESLSAFAVVKSFADVPLDTVKRKIEDDSNEEPPTKIAKIEETPAANGDVTIEKKETPEVVQEDVKGETGEEKKTEEAMEVDVEEETKPAETVEDKTVKEVEEKPSTEEKSSTEVKPPSDEKPESMEVVETAKTVDQKTDEKMEEAKQEQPKESEDKKESEIGTQTKTIMNECETQTTISIKAAAELPVTEVQKKLMETEAEKSKEVIENEDEKVVVSSDKDKKIETEKADKVENEVKTDEVKDMQKMDDTCDKKEATKENNIEPATETKKEETVTKEIEHEVKDLEKTDNKCDKVEEKTKEVEEKTKDIHIEIAVEAKEEISTEKVEKKEECKVDETKVKGASNELAEDKEKTNKESEEVVEKEKEAKQPEEVKENDSKEETKETETTVPKENGVTDKKDKSDVVEEKENKSELANSNENGVMNGEASSEASNGTVEKKEEEIKVKKIEDTIESAAVSVEV